MKTISEVVNKIDKVDPLASMRPIRPWGTYARWLERGGFLSAVAGEHDFNAVVDALKMSCESMGRGIFFTGGVGVGKTKVMQNIYDDCRHKKTWIDCNDATNIENLQYWDLHNFSVFVDDLGSERFKYGDYDIVGEAICRWYGRHDANCRLYVTSNLSGDGVDKRYGGRVLDRLSECCVICRMTGESKRKQEVVG